jgi:hypothetical protein
MVKNKILHNKQRQGKEDRHHDIMRQTDKNSLKHRGLTNIVDKLRVKMITVMIDIMN